MSVIICHDFNIHVCCPSYPMSSEFLDLVESFRVSQSVNEPTHSRDQIFGLVLSSDFPENTDLVDVFISDHKAVIFKAPLPSSSLFFKT